MSIIKYTIKNLIKKNITISIAESCTGGLIAHTLVKTSGVSNIFKFGLICYSNISKSKYLSIRDSDLKKYGSVSKFIATKMIDNLYNKEKTNITISTTGIAGPGGASKNKPVGLVYIGIKYKNINYLYKKNFKGSRIVIQRKTRDFVFDRINSLI
tara:strand:+ start:1291 stop:1755 length:465 start_codon:yes stop_codon:yes gene_type:complete